MKRFAAFLLVFSTFALAAVGAGTAADGNGYGPWEPAFQGPITAPAGVVCPFTVTAEPVRQDIRVRYHYDAAGNVDGYQVTGQLIGRITNTETGASAVRNLSGPGTVTFGQLLLFSGQTVLHGDANGVKTLVSHSGQVENLCDTLA